MSSYLSSDYSVQVSAKMIRVLWKQQQGLLKKSPDCVQPVINNDDPLDIQADIIGPKDTPYEGGVFRVKLFIPENFPQNAPKGFFLTKIFHPNVSEKGEICVNTLKRDWNPSKWSLYNVFEVIKCLMIVPFPQSSLNEEAGKIFMENYKEYFSIAKMLTEIHAKPADNKREPQEEKDAFKNDFDNNKTCDGSNSSEKTKKNGEKTKEKITENLSAVNTTDSLSYIKTGSYNSLDLPNNGNFALQKQLSNIQNDSGFGNMGINRSLSFNQNFAFAGINNIFDSSFPPVLNKNNSTSFNNNLYLSNFNGKTTDNFQCNKYKRSNSILENSIELKLHSTKEKPNICNLPFIQNSSSTNNSGNFTCGENNISSASNFLYQRSNTTNPEMRHQSSSDEINKWLMRI